MTSRNFWITTDAKTGQYVFALDRAEIAGINVPDINAPGMVIILKSGSKIVCTGLEGKGREEAIRFFLEGINK